MAYTQRFQTTRNAMPWLSPRAPPCERPPPRGEGAPGGGRPPPPGEKKTNREPEHDLRLSELGRRAHPAQADDVENLREHQVGEPQLLAETGALFLDQMGLDVVVHGWLAVIGAARTQSVLTPAQRGHHPSRLSHKMTIRKDSMRPEQWETFKRAARLEKQDNVPMAMIVDSPWIPGYLGIKHMDYYLDPELWFESNKKINEEFPDIIMVPSWWMEYGMAAEPSILGAKIKFWEDNTPSEYHTLYRLEDIDEFPGVRGRRGRLRGDDAASLQDGVAAHQGTRRGASVRHGARAAVHGGLRAQHDASHDRDRREAGRNPPVDRPLHPRRHRLAQGAAQGARRPGRRDLHPRRHRGLHQ